MCSCGPQSVAVPSPPSRPGSSRTARTALSIPGGRVMATKITSDVLESYLRCKFKGHLKLAGRQGTKCDFEAMLAELRAGVRLKAIEEILARHPGDQVARNVPLTAAGLRRGPRYILDVT